ncbi:MAG: hypothetical protein HRT54_23245 [Colwellia sp.]|nr:hypothetical protein [Colwellia sp.]
MNPFTRLFVVFAMVSINFVSHANTSPDNKKLPLTSSKPITYAQQITFHSKLLGKSQVMNVYLPENFEQSSSYHTYPVIFISDYHGTRFFHTLTGIVKHLSDVNRMPNSIVVSLNDTHAPEIYVNGMWSGLETNGVWAGIEKFDKYGQPDLYIRHLEEEVFPFLKENYRANNHRTIIGVSGSAIFPLNTFVKHPQIFNNYLFMASSDMIGMGLKKGHTFIEVMAESLSKGLGRREFLYFADADSDFNYRHAPPQQGLEKLNNLKKLKDELAVYKNEDFTFAIETITNESHYGAFLKTMRSAFEHMYPEKLWATEMRDLIKQPGDAMVNIDNFYHALSAKYGYEILPEANSLSIATRLLREGRPKEATSVAQRWSLYQPKSLAALFIWAQALEKSTLYKQALKKYQQLILLAKEQESGRLAEFKLAMQNMKNKIRE